MRIKGLLVIALFLLSTSCSTNSQGIEVTVNVGEFAYDPSAITVSAGQAVILTVKNKKILIYQNKNEINF